MVERSAWTGCAADLLRMRNEADLAGDGVSRGTWAFQRIARPGGHARYCVVAPALGQASYLHAPIRAFRRETISTRDLSAD